MPNTNISGKKIAMVVTFRDFRDAEYFIPADILTTCGAEIVNVSTQKGMAVGADGGDIEVQLTPQEFRVEDFDALVFVGGPGMGKNLENKDFQRMAQQAAKTGKVLGAICIAPVLLAKAGVLQGKKATVWSSPMDKSPINMLKEAGAAYQNEDVVIDDKIITANGPDAAESFGEALVEMLKT
jgi:protease I